MKLYTIFLSLATFFLVFLQAEIHAALVPDKEEKSPKKIKLYGPEDQYGLEEMIKDLENAKPGDIVFVNNFLVSNTKYIEALEKAASNGATVQIITNADQKSINNARNLQKKGISVFVLNPKLGKSLHTKTTGIAGTVLYDGSANATHQAYSGNKETVMRITNQDIIKSAFDDHNELIEKKSLSLDEFESAIQSPGKLANSPAKPALLKTPKKATRVTSLTTNIRGTLKRRIENTTNEDLWINFYGIDQKDMKEVIAEKHQNIKAFCVNYHNLDNPETKKFLIELRRNDVPVYIYNVDGKEKFANKYPLINHQKTIIRGDLVITGSENLTEKNSRDINQLTILPDPDLAKEMRKQILTIARESTPIEEIPQLEKYFADWYIQKSLERFESKIGLDKVDPKSEQLHYKLLESIAKKIENLGSTHPAYDFLMGRIRSLRQKVKDAMLKSSNLL